MNVGTDLVGAVFTGLTSLLVAIGGLGAVRASRAGVKRRELRDSRRYGLAADGWIFILERELVRHGVPIPDGKPQELVADDDGDPPAPPRRPAAAGA